MEIRPRGHLPNQATKLILRGIKYQGSELDITIGRKMYEVHVRTSSADKSVTLVYQHGTTFGLLNVNDRLSFPADTRLIIRRSTPLCHS